MLGLFGTLNLATRSLQTQQAAVEVAGQNLANVNNPAYARQRVQIQTSITLPTSLGPQGTGADAVSIQQIRDLLLDSQIQSELSVGGYWDAQQRALQYAQVALGEIIDSSSLSGVSTGLSSELNALFSAFQSVATSPASITERQVLLNQAQTIVNRLNQTAARLDDLKSTLDTSLASDASAANKLLGEIANLNDRVVVAEIASGGIANDLRDLRQQKLEELSRLTNIETSTAANGTVNVSISGTLLVSDRNVLDTLETYDAGGGQMMVRTVTGGTPLPLTGGSMQGKIDVRDGALASMRSDLDTLASELITQVNAVHSPGFSLTGSTGADFFTGTDAATIGVNAVLKADPSLVQAAGVTGVPGDNTVALALARLADTQHAALGNQTFSDAYGAIVGSLGYALNDANSQIADYEAVQGLLSQQRNSVSGVSLDEEMSDLIRFQRAYQASAKLITTVDEMLDTVLTMKR